MRIIVGLLTTTASVCWVLSLLTFIATTVMALDGWDTNFGAALALVAALFLTFLAQVVMFGAVLIREIGRGRNQLTDPFVPLRNLLGGATAVMVLATGMLLFTGFELRSPGVLYLLGNALITGIAAGVVAADDGRRTHRTRGIRGVVTG